MKGKKVFSFAAALVFLLSVSMSTVTALGANISRNVKISALTKLPTVKVVVPTTGRAIINPYNLTVRMRTFSTEDSVYYPTCALWSKSDVPLDMTATVSAVVPETSGVKLVNYSTRKDDAKTAYLYFQMKKFTVNASQIDGAYLDEDLEMTDWKGADTVDLENGKQTEFKGEGWQLPPVDKDGNPTAYIAYRFSGDVAESPDPQWTTADTVTLSVAFTFTVVPYI